MFILVLESEFSILCLEGSINQSYFSVKDFYLTILSDNTDKFLVLYWDSLESSWCYFHIDFSSIISSTHLLLSSLTPTTANSPQETSYCLFFFLSLEYSLWRTESENQFCS